MSISDNQCTSNSKGKCDPGWNDPPLFSYENITKSANKPKTLLNKRIAFPLRNEGPSNPSSDSSKTILPGSEPMSPIPPPISMIGINQEIISSDLTFDKSNDNNPLSLDSTQTLELVMENLNSVIHNCVFKDDKKSKEIQKRLEIMKKMWLENKLNMDIQKKMVTLSESLKINDYQSANDIQIGLMVDHVALCSSWMVGVRHLIQQVQS